MNNPILFLDFDELMFPNKVFFYPENHGEIAKQKCAEIELHPQVTYWKMDYSAVVMLNYILALDSDIRLVISSSWANPHFHTREHIVNLLKANGVVFTLHEDWATLKGGAH